MPAFAGHTTGRERLRSSGSYRPAWGPMQQPPVREECRVAVRNGTDPLLRAPTMPSQALVFLLRPTGEPPVKVLKCRVKCRWIVTTIVRQPTPNDGIEHPSQVVNPLVHSTAELLRSNLSAHTFASGIADRRTEVDEVLPPPILRPPGAKRIAQKIELLVWVCPPSVVILAVDNLCLLRMQLQPTLSKPLLQHALEPLRLCLAATVAENVIGEPLERKLPMARCHPSVERIVQEQIREQR